MPRHQGQRHLIVVEVDYNMVATYNYVFTEYVALSGKVGYGSSPPPVSYTHLTLPTIYSV